MPPQPTSLLIGRLAFVTEGGEQGKTMAQLYLANLNGTGRVKIEVGVRTWTIEPVAWSPDGRRLAFVGFHEAEVQGLYTVGADGADLRPVFRGKANIDFSWSPDGRLLACHLGRESLGVFASDGTGPSLMVQASEYVWSPDGQRLVYEWNWETYVAKADGTGRVLVATEPVLGFAWSPGGKRLVIAEKILREEKHSVIVMEADGGHPTRLVTLDAQIRNPRWSPDGRRIAFEAGPNSDVYLVKTDGSGLVRLLDGRLRLRDLAWSPDGRRLAFLAGAKQNGTMDIYVMNGDGTAPVRVTDQGATSPVWSPDGRRLLFTSVPFFSALRGGYPPEVRLYVAEAEHPLPVRVATYKISGINVFRPVWTPDGRRIIFTDDTLPPGTAIMAVEADGTNPARIGESREPLRELAIYWPH